MDWGLIVFVVAVAVVASTASTLVGFGFALISVPVFVTVLSVRETVVLETLLGILTSSMVAGRAWRHVPWRTVWWMSAGSVAGMPAGLVVLLFAPENALRLGVGVITIVMAGALIAGVRLGRSSVPRELGVGLLSGALNTSTSMSGPPVVLYLQGIGFPTQSFRGALSVFFVGAGLLTFVAFAATGVVTWVAVGLAAVAAPAVLAGSVAGHALLHRVEPALFRRLVFVTLTASALSAIATALTRIV